MYYPRLRSVNFRNRPYTYLSKHYTLVTNNKITEFEQAK